VLSRLSEKVARRLHQRSLQGRVIQLKIRDRGFHTFTRRHSLSVPTDSASTIRDQAMDLLRAMGWENVPVRLIGVTVAGLTAAGVVQGELFATAEERRRPRIDRVVDEIQDRFGGHAFLRGRSLLATGIDRTPWGATSSRTGRPTDSRTSPSTISERTPQ
jgi:DNA polymerase-4